MRALAALVAMAALWVAAAAGQTKSTAKKTVPKSTAKRKTVRKPVRRAPAITWQQRQEAANDIALALNAEIEAFDNAAALVPFFERLYRLGKDPGSVRVLHYGDSHTASDDLPGSLRESMQGRFGDGGPGFSLAGTPYRGYRRRDVAQYYNSRGWMTEGALFRKGDGRHGLGGISMTAYRPGEVLAMRAAGDTAELLFLQQPGGGSFEVWVDGLHKGVFNTDGPLGPASLDLTTAPGERQYQVRTTSPGPVRLFGSVIQNNGGVSWESSGINGAQLSIISDWDDRILASHVAKRAPALIVLAYGTNEANVPAWDPAAYWSGLNATVARLRAMAPGASILLIGPPDCKVRSARALEEVIQLQRKLAVGGNGGFWDWRTRMGGEGSMRKWVIAGLAQSDFVHFTGPGYQLIGRALHDDLMRLYDRFVRMRVETDDGKDK